MKHHRFKSITTILFFTLILLITACTKEPSKDTPVKTVRNTNPLNIMGYHYYEEKKTLSDTASLIATIDAISQIDENYLSMLNVLSYNDENIVLEYAVTNVSPDDNEEMGEIGEPEKHLALIDTDTLAVLREITVPNYSYIQRNINCITVDTYEENGSTLKAYDYELNEIAEVQLPPNAAGLFSADGKRCYYNADQKLYAYNTENDVCKEMKTDANFIANNIISVITDDFGNDYVIFWGMAPDYNEYQFILNSVTNEIVWISAMEDKLSSVTNNVYVEYNYDNTQWLIGLSNKKAFDYSWDGEGINLNYFITQNQNVLFVHNQDEQLNLYLYDYKTADLLGTTSFEVTDMRSSLEPEYVEQNWAEVVCYDAPVYIDDDTILLHLINFEGKHFFIEWNLAVSEDNLQKMTVSEHQMGSIASIDISSMNNPLYVPEKLSEHLESLRKKADTLEDKYKVDIYIGEECGNVIGGFAIKPLTDYELIESALEILEQEMERYPANFFSQFKYSWLEGLDIYLTSTISGTSAENLGIAGGFQTVHNSNVLIVLDCEYPGNMSTFHHELSHAIDDKITDESYFLEEPYFSEEKWNALNPFDDMYTHTYTQYGHEKYYDYAYYNRVYNDGKIEDIYFIDSYSMTFPTEDRATLFEAVMTDQIDLEQTPYLADKMEYYSECIRKTFDTDEWDKAVPWEMN